MDLYRVFVSSPGDALRERQRLDAVVRRLNGEFAGRAQLAAIRWESSFYQAHATFQAQIPQADACDLVVAIFRGRLGTELPPDFERMANGEPYPSGTAYELLTAIEKRRRGAELPDVYVFRCPEPPSVRLDDAKGEAIIRDQWERLKGFFGRFFVTPEGHFKAAFQTFVDTDDFERQLERLLRDWLSRKVQQGREAVWPIAVKGSPFPGLRAYGSEHAAVFFGRSRDRARALEAWCQAAARGTPFLLIVGASGSGKSSLLRAGIAPRLMTPGVVASVDAWRLVEMRPNEDAQGPIAALAAALMRKPAADASASTALPEIVEGAYASPAELAALLAHADAAAVKPVIAALSRVSAQLAREEGLTREARCDLVLLIDQLDELFAASVPDEERARFGRLLAALAATGRIWIGATLRADLYELLLREPSLFALKEQGTAYDLNPPGFAELAEIVRKPAELAGLVYERDQASGEGLDERLLRDADRPDMLPLLQLALARLFEARETRRDELHGDETVLTLSAYEAQGGLSGIIDRAGEAALAGLDVSAIAALPRLLRHLAEPSQGREVSLTVRDAPLGEAAPDPPARALARALVEARLLQSRGEGGEAVIRLSHQRVLTDWARAGAIVADSADFYRIRAEIEARREAYEAAGCRPELLLPRGLPLAQAESITRRYGEELSPQALAFVAASRRRANRAQMLTGIAACLFGLVAVGAGIFAKLAVDQRHAARLAAREAQAQRAVAERNLAAAETAIHGLTFDVAQGLRGVTGMRIETVHDVLERVRRTVDTLGEVAGKDPVWLRDRAAMLQEFVTTYRQAGDLRSAEASARESLGYFDRLAAQDPGNPRPQRDLALGERVLSGLLAATGKRDEALAAAERSLALTRAIAAQHPDAPDAELDLAASLDTIGGLRLAAADRTRALAAYDEALAVIRKLATRDPDNSEWLANLSAALGTRGELLLAGNDTAGALAALREALTIDRRFIERRPDDGKWSARLASTLTGLADAELAAGDVRAALAADDEAVTTNRKLVARDPGNLEWRRNLAVTLGKSADAKLASGDRDAALALYDEALRLDRGLAVHDPDNADWQRGISIVLERLGDLRLKGGDVAGAASAFEELLTIRRVLSRRDPGNADWGYDLALALNRVAALDRQRGDHAAALALALENITTMRSLVARDPANAIFARHLARSLEEVAGWRSLDNDRAAAQSWGEAADMRRTLLTERPDDPERLDALALDLDILGGARFMSDDYTQAAAAYNEEVAVMRHRVALPGSSPKLRMSLADALDHVAAARDMLKNPAAELAARRESLSIRRALIERGEGDAKSLAELATDFGYVVDLVAAGASPDQAAAIAQEALPAARSIAAAEPADAQRLADVAQHLAVLANARAAAGARAEAVTLDEEAAAITRRLQLMAPTDQGPIIGLALLLDRLGDWKSGLGDRPGALAANRELLDMGRRLLALHPGEPQWRINLAYALVKTAEQSDDGAAELDEARAILADLDDAALPPPLHNFKVMVAKRLAAQPGAKP